MKSVRAIIISMLTLSNIYYAAEFEPIDATNDKKETEDLIQFAKENPKFLKTPNDTGDLPIHMAIYSGNESLIYEYAKLYPESIAVRFNGLSVTPLQYLFGSSKLEIGLKLFEIYPNAATYLSPTQSNTITILNLIDDRMLKNINRVSMENFLRKVINPQLSKYSPELGGSLEFLRKTLDTLIKYQENSNRDYQRTELLRERIFNSYKYLKNIDKLTAEFPNAINPQSWNPKLQMLMIEIYLHTVLRFEEFQNGLDATTELCILNFQHYNNFISRLFSKIQESKGPVTINYDTPSILHTLHDQLRLVSEYQSQHVNDSNTVQWKYVHTILFDLTNKISQSSPFQKLAEEFKKRQETNSKQFYLDVKRLSVEYIRSLADFRIDYRALDR